MDRETDNREVTAEERVERVSRMEEVYDNACAAVEKLLAAAEEYMELRESVSGLERYYEDGRWMSDFFAEREDLFPKDIKRGILTEDAIYDLLTDQYRLKLLLEEIIRTM